jgi:hypothetical protein
MFQEIGETKSEEENDVDAEVLFKNKLESLIKEKGGEVRLSSKWDSPYDVRHYYLGEQWVSNDDGDGSYQVSIGIGKFEFTIYEFSEKKINAQGESFDITRRSPIYKYTFYENESLSFDQIISLLPKNAIYRIVEKSEELVIYFYPNVSGDKKLQETLMRTIVPFANGVVHFGQGEWVVLDGVNHHHVLASSGASECRQYLLYDPVTKKVAATHLDFPEDVEAVQEMAGYLKRHGCLAGNLKLFASENMELEVRRELLRLYPDAVFDLNYNYKFDASSGQFEELDEETEQFIFASRGDRSEEKTSIRQKYNIPQMLAYEGF